MTPFRRDIVSKSLAGVVLGFALALALVGLFARLGPQGLEGGNKYQLVMWMIAPIWLSVLAFVFLFRSGLRAWLWLGGASLLAHGGLHACRLLLH
ncbi:MULTISPECIES: hypothetical protein [Methylosinus]|uniref:Uncharacterized protein n=1 Tax=Methylosinus trichosporium (strain ATCC 35070 / NCIMB 11131 / UNIQEM 75 / OB3b) TaxID=595536 RepID=A0A2D2CVJ3_METT3|nr:MULTISPECIES: hypothetical protein [Methylosinus]ATQ66788.1 hypothetical protein CQW49_01925 [Methylosinus trichosporium OB3b]OBS54193.1 hypothetical protein A8B73_01940 [Methylosinus sp. 3S-1]